MESSPPSGDKDGGGKQRNPAVKRARSSQEVEGNHETNHQNRVNESHNPKECKGRSFKDACIGKELDWPEVIGQLNMDNLSLEQGVDDGTNWPTLNRSKDQFKEMCEPWRKTLIVKILGKALGFKFLHQRLR
ncbi:hypothetical protein CCACVL1_30770 [Corchorus capsularis]|uniref:Uncharacterized protein n=1 Tax=Corchorus capsularis TaxID=210143 RepID=A0A1R3FVY8_COCAP|nr:hypothetical protein CCACVL1_30770 [Corchorus capsularis]